MKNETSIVERVSTSRYFALLYERKNIDDYHILLKHLADTNADAELILLDIFTFGVMAGIREERKRRREGWQKIH